MTNLAVTGHQHAPVAPAARSGSSSDDATAAFVSSFEQLLQGGIVPRRALPPAPEGLRIEGDGADRGDRSAEGPADDRARPIGLIRKRIKADPAPMLDHGRQAEAPPPVRRESDRDPAAPRDLDATGERPDEHIRERSRERADRRGAGPAAEPAEADVPPSLPAEAAPPAAEVPAPAPPPSAGPSAQGGPPSPAAPGASWPLLSGAAAADLQNAPVTPAPGPAAASVTSDADILVSQPTAALAPAAAIAVEGLHGTGARLRGTTGGPAPGGTGEPAGTGAGASEAGTTLDAEGSATLGAATRAAGGPQTIPAAAAPAVAGGANAAAAAGLGGGQGQMGQVRAAHGQQGASGAAATAIPAAADAAAAPLGTSPAAPSAGTAPNGRGPAGIVEGAASGSVQAPQQPGRAAGAASASAPRAAPVPPRMVGDQVSVHIRKAVHEGSDRIEIRLKPEALGRVDVRLELGADNRVVATVTAEQRHTLELLRADARNLERALQEAGLQTDGGSLNFNLRGGDDGRPGRHDGHATGRSLHDANATGGENVQELPPQAYGRPAGRPDGIDIRA